MDAETRQVALPTQWQNEIPFELAALAGAERYQSWVFRTIAPYVGTRVLEIGAGIGNMSRWLPTGERLILTENEPELLRILQKSRHNSSASSNDPRVSVTRFDFARDAIEPFISENLDTIVSFNVLEHVEDDRAALERMVRILKESKAPGPKRLVTFVPAHAWAYGTMDRSFGHYRRYSASKLLQLSRELAPEARTFTRHFNLLGLPGWILQGRILRKQSIGLSAIAVFEKLCPWLSPIDDFLHEKLRLPVGQSLLVVSEWN